MAFYVQDVLYVVMPWMAMNDERSGCTVCRDDKNDKNDKNDKERARFICPGAIDSSEQLRFWVQSF